MLVGEIGLAMWSHLQTVTLWTGKFCMGQEVTYASTLRRDRGQLSHPGLGLQASLFPFKIHHHQP